MATGVTTQKNSLGEIVLVASLFLVWGLAGPTSCKDDRRENQDSVGPDGTR